MERIVCIGFIIIISFPQKVFTTNRSFACGKFVHSMNLMIMSVFFLNHYLGVFVPGVFGASPLDRTIFFQTAVYN